MPETGDFAFPFPVGGDDPDVPADITALATRIAAVLSGSAINRPAQFQRAADPNPVTVLPAAPADDEIVIYRVDSVTDWRMIWDATNARWKKIGGPPLIARETALLTDVAYPSPNLTVPRTGRYRVHLSHWTWYSGPGRGYTQLVLTRDGGAPNGFPDLTNTPICDYRGVDWDDHKHAFDETEADLTAGWSIHPHFVTNMAQGRSQYRIIKLDPLYLT